MKKSILSIMMAFAMFFQATAHAYTASNEVTNKTVKDMISYVNENPNKFPSETVAAAEFLQNKNIELSQEKLNQLNALVLQQTEVAYIEGVILGSAFGIIAVAIIVGAVLLVF